MKSKYIPQKFEEKWIKKWEKDNTYAAKEDKDKAYILDMFPYPSGGGLHVGHTRIYTASDVLARFYRLKGKSVLHPMGWDAFGLPAENAAIKAKKNPMDMVPANIANFKRQMKLLGLSYDWDKEFSTTDPEYYKWTQWLFIQFFKAGLLYKKSTPVYYCAFCKTGIAEEEVLASGKHERCGNDITRKTIPQWIFKITHFADELLEDLDNLDWPEGIKKMQRNWIGKSEGREVTFKLEIPASRGERNSKFETTKVKYIKVFTTRPDTIDAVTAIIIAPEHELVEEITDEKVKKYVEDSKKKLDLARSDLDKDKTGIFSGFYAENPVNKEKIPIWIADYVVGWYGYGAIMFVPGVDKRDLEFAKKYNLPIKKHENNLKKIDYKKLGKKNTQYKLRDWNFSRQRYWGEPIPMVFCKNCDDWLPIDEKELPLKLPYLKSYGQGKHGQSPLAEVKEWVNTKCPKCMGTAIRETDTMPNWAGSCWYFLAFSFWDKEKAKLQTLNNKSQINNKSKIQNSKRLEFRNSDLFGTWNLEFSASIRDWLPVDWYLGGAEHAVLHLLYSRFWVKALHKLKLLDIKEPFYRLRNVGIVIAEDKRKMSKSFGNIINPDNIIKEYGADSLRITEMFMAPFSQEIVWSTHALQGAYRFLKRVWQIINDPNKIASDSKNEDLNVFVELEKTIQKIENSISKVKFNTGVSFLMEFLNIWEKGGRLTRENIKKFLIILSPYAPFITEELWETVFKEKKSIHLSNWPKFDKKHLLITDINIPIQVNGKLKAVLKIPNEKVNKDYIIDLAKKESNVTKFTQKGIVDIIYVERKVLNFVVKN